MKLTARAHASVWCFTGVASAALFASAPATSAQSVGTLTATFWDVWYDDDHWRQRLDLYIPSNGCTQRPLVIYIHGGGWLVGDKAEVAPHVDSLLQRGFAVASINYRYSYQQIWPAQIHDCKGALRFLRANAAAYRLDPTRFAVFGDSAGGHLAAVLGTTSGVSFLEGTVGGNQSFASTVQIVGDLFGPTDLFELGAYDNSPSSIVSQLFGHPIQDIIDNMDHPSYANLVALVHSANPIREVNAGDPPFRIAHGLDDATVPPSQSQMLFDALVNAGVPANLRMIPGAAHRLPQSEYQLIFDAFATQLNPVQYKPGDANCNGQVNIDDLVQVITHWGACPKPCPLQCPGDVAPVASGANAGGGDCVVNIDDLVMVITNWGQ